MGEEYTTETRRRRGNTEQEQTLETQRMEEGEEQEKDRVIARDRLIAVIGKARLKDSPFESALSVVRFCFIRVHPRSSAVRFFFSPCLRVSVVKSGVI